MIVVFGLGGEIEELVIGMIVLVVVVSGVLGEFDEVGVVFVLVEIEVVVVVRVGRVVEVRLVHGGGVGVDGFVDEFALALSAFAKVTFAFPTHVFEVLDILHKITYYSLFNLVLLHLLFLSLEYSQLFLHKYVYRRILVYKLVIYLFIFPNIHH